MIMKMISGGRKNEATYVKLIYEYNKQTIYIGMITQYETISEANGYDMKRSEDYVSSFYINLKIL